MGMIAAVNQQRSAKGVAVGGDGKVFFGPSDVGRDMNRGRLGPQLHERCRQHNRDCNTQQYTNGKLGKTPAASSTAQTIAKHNSLFRLDSEQGTAPWELRATGNAWRSPRHHIIHGKSLNIPPVEKIAA